MPPLKQPQGWRYLKARLRLLNRPQALGTVVVLLASGMVLVSYWRRLPVAPGVPSSVPAASAPVRVPSDPLGTLGQPPIEPSPNPDLPTPAIAPLPSSADSDQISLPVIRPSPTVLLESAPAGSTAAPSVSRSNGLMGIDLVPASPAAPLSDPLRSAIAAQTQSRNPILPAAEPLPANPVAPYATSPPPGTTGYILPPTLSPSPIGLPAARPEVTGAPTLPPYRVAPAPTAPIAPQPQPQLVPGQSFTSELASP